MDLAHQLQASLSTTSIPLPSLAWLQSLASARSPPPPLASLLATARARLLASDLTAAGLLDSQYAAQHSLPQDMVPGSRSAAATTREARLPRDVVVQVLDIEDVSQSRWEQVEALEALARGEGTRGREIVRLSATTSTDEEEATTAASRGEDADGEGQGQQAANGGGRGRNSTHKLVVQDCKGQTMHAIELKQVERLGVGKTFIGEKVLLRAGTVVARGVVLLDPAQCVVLGGKVDAWHRAWVDGRLARLKEAVGADRRA
ncbi:hypothetical protein C7999DRAFT_29454 [Corynascus novoguineensis]|uniref:RecQ-mediated genome instability protein 1 n=1 Tax=Corynascus novoguineensis TaxID=1126955 RepID=A0AAN7CZK1_9PEZI|nr:hypothetical protein C7999DRAFT_29454 [Corynascus novoguineensis]